jgi:hypothetical protein
LHGCGDLDWADLCGLAGLARATVRLLNPAESDHRLEAIEDKTVIDRLQVRPPQRGRMVCVNCVK